MSVDRQLEALYAKVELVRGVGKPRRGELCIMSLVAFLAGERHSDHPHTASPAIRRFAITINDQMPDHLRPRLKPFAPAIIGTRDELDCLRAEMLIAAVFEEVLPRMRTDFGERLNGEVGLLRRARGLRVSRPLPRLSMILGGAAEGDWMPTPGQIAAATADLLVRCAREAPTAAVSLWYWTKAIDLLDRLTQIRRARPNAIDPARITHLDHLLARYQRSRTAAGGTNWALDRVRRLLPDWATPD